MSKESQEAIDCPGCGLAIVFRDAHVARCRNRGEAPAVVEEEPKKRRRRRRRGRGNKEAG